MSARSLQRKQMLSLLLRAAEIEQLWSLLCEHASLPLTQVDERINYDDFSRVAGAMSEIAGPALFHASHFLKFPLDGVGRISIVHYFHWVRAKNAMMRTRVELACHDAAGDGSLTERELESWVGQLLPTLPALSELRPEFEAFYKVTAVRKFLFFLDVPRKGRISLRAILSSPILHELFELRRPLSAEALRNNWFSLENAHLLYSEYLELDEDQNGMLCAAELARYGEGGLTTPFIQRVFQECNTYRNKETFQSELDYKSYLDFVLAMSYKATTQSLNYFFRLLDIHKRGCLTALEVSYFFRAILDKFVEVGEDPNCTAESVIDEIFDMVNPAVPSCISLDDLHRCKVGDTVVGMLTDVWAFWQYDRREQFIHADEGGQ